MKILKSKISKFWLWCTTRTKSLGIDKHTIGNHMLTYMSYDYKGNDPQRYHEIQKIMGDNSQRYHKTQKCRGENPQRYHETHKS